MRDRLEYERIKDVVSKSSPEKALTAREIHELLADQGEDMGSSHRIATVLGRHAETEGIAVIRGSPYKYRIEE